jgi:hypothetical protein
MFRGKGPHYATLTAEHVRRALASMGEEAS